MNLGNLTIGPSGLDPLRLMGWSDGGVAVVVNSGRESLPQGEGQQLNNREANRGTGVL